MANQTERKEIFKNFKNIPQELQSCDQWILRGGENKKQPMKGWQILCDPTKNEDWLTWGDCLYLFKNNDFDGIGFCVQEEDPFILIDIDAPKGSSLFDQWGELLPEYAEIVESFNTYTEKSQSGNGLHIIGKVNKNKVKTYLIDKLGTKIGQYEMYIGQRYFALTGDVIGNYNKINKVNEAAEKFYYAFLYNEKLNNNGTQELIPSPHLETEEIIQKALNAKNSEKFKKLFIEGDLNDYHNDYSSGDQALFNILTFYTQDREQIFQIWQQSAIYNTRTKNKKKTRNENTYYVRHTFNKAIKNLSATWQPNNSVVNMNWIVNEENNTIELPTIFDKNYCVIKEKKDKEKDATIISYFPKLCSENIDTLLKNYNIELKFNLLSKEYEIIGFNNYEENNAKLKVFLQWLYDRTIEHSFTNNNMNIIKSTIEAIAHHNSYNPIEDYLNTLTPLNSTHELEKLANTLVTPQDFSRDFKILLIKTWLISCVRSGLAKNGFKSEGILVLQGKQGLKKSTWFEKLFNNKTFFKDGLSIDPSNKDSIANATKYWVVELGEIGSTFKKDIDKIKAFISQSIDEYRESYGYFAMKHPRRTIFCGTVNEDAFLKDDTGNRRFWIIPCDNILPTQDIDYNKVWAEILWIVQNTEPQKLQKEGKYPEGKWWLEPLELEQLQQVQKTHEVSDHWDTYIEAKINWNSEEFVWLTTLEIFEKLGSPNGLTKTKIGRSLTKLNVESGRFSNNVKKYKIPSFKNTLDNYFDDNGVPNSIKDHPEIKKAFGN